MKHYEAPWSTSLIVMSVLTTVLCLGSYRAYVTAPRRTVVLRYAKRQVVLPLNRQVVGRASRLPSGHLALRHPTAGETPGAAGETPAPLFRPPGSGAQGALDSRGVLSPATPEDFVSDLALARP